MKEYGRRAREERLTPTVVVKECSSMTIFGSMFTEKLPELHRRHQLISPPKRLWHVSTDLKSDLSAPT